MRKTKWMKKMIIIVGSIIVAYGITLAMYAGFGGATLAVLWQGISKTFSHQYRYGIFDRSCSDDRICIIL